MPCVNEQGTSEKYTYAREEVDTTSAALAAKLLHLLCLVHFYPCVRVFFTGFLFIYKYIMWQLTQQKTLINATIRNDCACARRLIASQCFFCFFCLTVLGDLER